MGLGGGQGGGREGDGARSSGGEVLQHMSKKLANSGTGKQRLMSQLQMEDLSLSNLQIGGMYC